MILRQISSSSLSGEKGAASHPGVRLTPWIRTGELPMDPAIRILYVDDEPALLDISKIFLEQSGEFSVDTALSASAAVNLLKTENYDAIISDYQMPEID